MDTQLNFIKCSKTVKLFDAITIIGDYCIHNNIIYNSIAEFILLLTRMDQNNYSFIFHEDILHAVYYNTLTYIEVKNKYITDITKLIDKRTIPPSILQFKIHDLSTLLNSKTQPPAYQQFESFPPPS